jgi:oligopeptide transport system substrate-binding protein
MSLLEEGSSEDYLKIRTPEFLELLANLKKSISQANKYQEACNKTIKYLLAQHFLIPTGPIHFTLLAKPEWTGWTLNEMNQLDLSGLKKH